MIRDFKNLSIEDVEFLVNFYDAFDYNFTQGYCSVDVEETEYHSILEQLDRKESA